VANFCLHKVFGISHALTLSDAQYIILFGVERARLAQNFVLDEKGFVYHEPDDFQEK